MASAVAGSSGERVRTAGGDLLFSVPVARGLAFAALVSWGALHWMSMLQPAEPGRGWAVVGVSLLAMCGLLLVGRVHGGARRALALVALLIPLLALMLLAGGARDELLLPSNWSELTGGISRGISDLPGVRVPYRGIDPWVRFVIPLGGSALALVAALLAFWPRRGGLGRPYAALIVADRPLRHAGRGARLPDRVPARRGLHAADGLLPAAGEAADAGRRRGRAADARRRRARAGRGAAAQPRRALVGLRDVGAGDVGVEVDRRTRGTTPTVR